MQELLPYFEIVEEAIRKFNLDPKDALGNEPGTWFLNKGRAQTKIMVWMNADSKIPYIRVVCPIVQIPEGYHNYDMLVEFMELNSYYIGVKFVKSANSILLGVDKEANTIDTEELFLMINRVLNVGSNEIPRLEEKYSGEINDFIKSIPSDTVK